MTLTEEQMSNAATTNMERAMMHMARAGALEDERWGMLRGDKARYADEINALHNSGAFWMQARMLCTEMGRDWDAVTSSARSYAHMVMGGHSEVTN